MKRATGVPATLRCTGVWIDLHEAVVISLSGKEAVVRMVRADERRHLRTLRSKNTGSRFGDHFVSDEKKQLGREREEMRRFTGRVIDAIGRPDRLVIFGPAQARLELNKAVAREHPRMSVAVVATDTMSRDQKVAWVKRYFAQDPVRSGA